MDRGQLGDGTWRIEVSCRPDVLTRRAAIRKDRVEQHSASPGRLLPVDFLPWQADQHACMTKPRHVDFISVLPARTDNFDGRVAPVALLVVFVDQRELGPDVQSTRDRCQACLVDRPIWASRIFAFLVDCLEFGLTKLLILVIIRLDCLPDFPCGAVERQGDGSSFLVCRPRIAEARLSP